MPHLVEMDKRNRKKGLRIIATERQNSSEDVIAALTKKNKVEYTITRGTSGPVDGSGIPHAYVFDVSGKLIFNGHPSDDEFERTVKKALREVADDSEKKSTFGPSTLKVEEPLIAERNWTNAEGKEIVASVTAVAGDFVSFKMKNGKVVSYPIEKLSEEDQALIKETAESQEE